MRFLMKGLPASLYEQVQEFGRVDRQMNVAPGSNKYDIHLDFNSYVLIFLQTFQRDNATEQNTLLCAHHPIMGIHSFR